MDSILTLFIAHLKYERHASPHTLRNYKTDLQQFLTYLRRVSSDQPELNAVSNLTIRQWISTLHSAGKTKTSIARKLAAANTFFKFLVREEIIDSNPVKLIRITKYESKLPVHLSTENAISFVQLPDINTHIGKRDHAILELLYATGIRVSELTNLDVRDIDFDDQLLRVLQSRGPERAVPFGKPARNALRDYLSVRRKFFTQPHQPSAPSQALMLSIYGTRMTDRSIGRLVQKYKALCESAPAINPRSLRHSFTASMLDAGADVRDVQHLLGHARITTTQKYAAISIAELSATYESAMSTLPIDHRQAIS